jgi:hypothetical protein
MMEYEAALALLDKADTWCEGAEALAAMGDSRALIPLMRAYEISIEADKLCLADAMDALGARESAASLLANGNVEEKRLALRMMQLFPHNSNLPHLRDALSENELQDQAARALISQYQSEAWVSLMIDLLQSKDERVRGWVIDGLRFSPRDTAQAGLREHLPHESNPMLKLKLKAHLRR